MSGVKRYDVLGDCDGGYLDEAKEGRAVLYTDYAALETELKKVKADRSACWAEFNVLTKSGLDAECERDVAMAECERLTAMLHRASKAESRPEFMQIIAEALSAKP